MGAGGGSKRAAGVLPEACVLPSTLSPPRARSEFEIYYFEDGSTYRRNIKAWNVYPYIRFESGFAAFADSTSEVDSEEYEVESEEVSRQSPQSAC